MSKERNIIKMFSRIKDYYSHKIIGEVNDVFIKINKVKGHEVPWHAHDEEDEMFFILRGSLMMELEKEESFELKEGEYFIVRKGIQHRTYSEDECWLMLIEKKSTRHTGNIHTKITKSIKDQY